VGNGHLDPLTDKQTAFNGGDAANMSGRGVIETAFGLLDLVADLEPVRLVDLADATGLPRTTVHRLMRQLIAVGAVRRDGARYRLGVSLLGLGARVSPERRLRVAARRPITELAAITGATVSLSAAIGDDVVYLDTVDARVPLGFVFEPGAQVLPGTAQAQAHSAGRGSTPNAPLLDVGGVIPDLSCVAVPIPLATGEVAAIAVVMKGNRPPSSVLDVTRITARRIGDLLHEPSAPVDATSSENSAQRTNFRR
jgi:DNA-binding IclR family transcriptional regulator